MQRVMRMHLYIAMHMHLYGVLRLPYRKITIVEAWSSLVEGDEASYLLNCQSNLVIALHVPSLFFVFSQTQQRTIGQI